MIKLERKTTEEMLQYFRNLFVTDRMEFEKVRMQNDLLLAKIEYLEGYFETDFKGESQEFRNGKIIMDVIAGDREKQFDVFEIKTLDDEEIAEVLEQLIFVAIFSE